MPRIVRDGGAKGKGRSGMTVVHGRHNRSVTLSFPTAPDAVELRHLRAFVAVAAELNFGRAAERLYITQPALSRQIRALEKALGCELLRRSTHRVELTLAGEAMLDRSHDVLRGVDEAVAAAQSVGGELAERVERLWAPLAGIDGPRGAARRLTRPCTRSSRRRPSAPSAPCSPTACPRSRSSRRARMYGCSTCTAAAS